MREFCLTRASRSSPQDHDNLAYGEGKDACAWERYRHRAADLLRELGFTAEVNDPLPATRGMVHKVDVSARIVLAGVEVLWIVEYKLWNRAVPKEKVSALSAIRGSGQAHRGAGPHGCLSPLVAELRPGPGERFLPPPSVVRDVDPPVGAQAGGVRPDGCRVGQRSPAAQRNPPKSRPSIGPI
jgi:hypothetical protein